MLNGRPAPEKANLPFFFMFPKKKLECYMECDV